MRYIFIAILIFCIQIGNLLFVTLINDSNGIMPDTQLETTKQWINVINDTDETIDAQTQSADVGGFLAEFKFYMSGLWRFIQILAIGVLVFPTTLINFGLPTNFALIIGLPINLIYWIGILQIITKQSWRGNE